MIIQWGAGPPVFSGLAHVEVALVYLILYSSPYVWGFIFYPLFLDMVFNALFIVWLSYHCGGESGFVLVIVCGSYV